MGESVDIVVSQTGADEAAQSIQALGNAADAAAAKVDSVSTSASFLKDAATSTVSPVQQIAAAVDQSSAAFDNNYKMVFNAATQMYDIVRPAQEAASAMQQNAAAVDQQSASLGKLTPALEDNKNSLDKNKDAAHGAAEGTDVFREALGFLQEALVFLGLALSVDKVLGYAEAWEQTGIRLQSVSGSLKEAADIQHQLIDVSNETGSAFENNAQAYQKLRTETRGMNIDSTQLISVIRDVNAAVRLSGGSTDDASRALDIFSRALATGQVEGRQFRTLLRDFPALGALVTEGMGKAAADLVKVSTTVATTSKEFIDGFTKAGGAVADQAKKMELTLGQSLTVLKNNLLAYVGELNESSHATGLLSTAIQFIAEHFSAFADTARAAITVIGSYVLIMNVIPGVLNLATTAVRLFTAALAANPIGLLVVAITAAIALIYQFGSAIKLNATGSITLLGAIVGAFNFVVEKVKELWTWLSQYLLPVWDVIKAVALAAIQPVIDVFKALLDVLTIFIPSLQTVSDELTKMSAGLVQAMKDASKATDDTKTSLTDFGNTAKSTADTVAQANAKMKASTKDAATSMQQDIAATAAEYKKLEFQTQDSMGKIVTYLDETDKQSGRLFNDIEKGAQNAGSALKNLSSAASSGGGGSSSSGGGGGSGKTSGYDQQFQDDKATILKYYHAAGGKNDAVIDAAFLLETTFGTQNAIAAAIKFSKLLGGESDAAKGVIKAEMPAVVSELAASGLPGFYNGGQFMVGGSGGQDSQLVQFLATPGEKVTVETPDQQKGLRGGYGGFSGGARPINVKMTVHTPDANSFRRSQNQTLLQLRSRLNNVGKF